MLVVVGGEPVGEGVATLLLAGVAAGVGPPVGHGPAKPFYLAVGLWTVRPRVLRRDRQRLAGVAPQVRSVRAAVVRQDALDRDAGVCEPLDGAVQDADSRDSGLIVMYLGVCHAGVVVDDGVDERVAELGVVPFALWLAGRGRAVAFSLAASDVAPPSGMFPSFFTSTCTSDPGCGCSYRRTSSPVARSRYDRRFRRAVVRMRGTVDGEMPSREAS